MENETLMKFVTVLQENIKEGGNLVLQTGLVDVVFPVHGVKGCVIRPLRGKRNWNLTGINFPQSAERRQECLQVLAGRDHLELYRESV
jgi:hypothetical protein